MVAGSRFKKWFLAQKAPGRRWAGPERPLVWSRIRADLHVDDGIGERPGCRIASSISSGATGLRHEWAADDADERPGSARPVLTKGAWWVTGDARDDERRSVLEKVAYAD